jgi:hypothetical protein
MVKHSEESAAGCLSWLLIWGLLMQSIDLGASLDSYYVTLDTSAGTVKSASGCACRAASLEVVACARPSTAATKTTAWCILLEPYVHHTIGRQLEQELAPWSHRQLLLHVTGAGGDHGIAKM